MAHVNVTVSGRTYRMACADGEEAQLEALASGLDAKIGEMREAFGELGEMRLHVMAALTLVDEIAETRGRVARLEAEMARLRETLAARTGDEDGVAARLASAVEEAAARIEAAAHALSGAPRE